MPPLSVTQLDALMQEALAEAEKGALLGEVPVGAIIVSEDKIIARAHNLTESNHDCTAHAEILAIRGASRTLNNWRLSNCVLVATLEPCSMCISAAKLARIPFIVFGAWDQKAGAVGSIYDLSQDVRTGAAPRIVSGVMEGECVAVLKKFFERRRAE